MKVRGNGIGVMSPLAGVTLFFTSLLVFSTPFLSATEPLPAVSEAPSLDGDPAVDQLLQLKEGNAEALRSRDVEIEQEVERDKTKIRSHTRMAFDKAIGKMRLQEFGPEVTLRADMMVEGTKAKLGVVDNQEARSRRSHVPENHMAPGQFANRVRCFCLGPASIY